MTRAVSRKVLGDITTNAASRKPVVAEGKENEVKSGKTRQTKVAARRLPVRVVEKETPMDVEDVVPQIVLCWLQFAK